MKVLSDKSVQDTLKGLTKKDLVEIYQPWLLKDLQYLADYPESLPHRIIKSSMTPGIELNHFFMPSIGDGEVGLKILAGGPTNSLRGLGFVGSIVILDETSGAIAGVVNAKTVTAFRTALASSLPMLDIIGDKAILPEITVLGSGLQAYWHAKLVLLLFGDRIQKVNLANRTLANAEKLKLDLQKDFPKTEMVAHAYPEETDEFVLGFRNSSFILGCVPSTEAVIKKEYLNSDANYIKYINLIGSYKPHMYELDLDVVREFGAKILVDSKEHTLHEAGELIQTSKTPEDLVEIAEYCKNPVEVIGQSGIVILKIVGLATMDVSVGKLILSQATAGVDIPDF